MSKALLIVIKTDNSVINKIVESNNIDVLFETFIGKLRQLPNYGDVETAKLFYWNDVSEGLEWSIASDEIDACNLFDNNASFEVAIMIDALLDYKVITLRDGFNLIKKYLYINPILVDTAEGPHKMPIIGHAMLNHLMGNQLVEDISSAEAAESYSLPGVNLSKLTKLIAENYDEFLAVNS